MSATYTDAVWRVRASLDRIEAWLFSHREEKIMTFTQVQQEICGPDIAYDQIALALHALANLGIIEESRGGAINFARFEETAGFRQGVREGIDHATAAITPSHAQLLVALPKGLAPQIERSLRLQADDLPAALVSMLAAAQHRLLIASPFWDDETISPLADILERRLQTGVHVDLLGRSVASKGEREYSFAHIARRLKGFPGCRVFTWYKPWSEDRFGTQTFHFKCIVADGGTRAYLGSANLTSASFRSRMELGVVLIGEHARYIAQITTVALSLAEEWEG